MTKPMFAGPGFRILTIGRLVSVEDAMGAVVYVASGATALETGASLLVDGGWTATRER
jgi:hypothetical protein